MWSDFMKWRDEIGLKKGVLFDDDGTITFVEWPFPPHENVVSEIISQFDRQFISPYSNQPGVYPTFESFGSTGNKPLLC